METSKNAKKEKKRDKKRKHKKHSSSTKATLSTDSSSENSSDDWTEAPSKTSKSEASERVGQRDAWMDLGDIIPTITAKEHKARKRAEKAKEQCTERMLSSIDKPGQHARELNPYWKEGGIGLPEEKRDEPKEPTLVKSSVGDGGLRWLRRAYQRIQEQAVDEGRTLEEVAAERYGSLEKLESMIREAELRTGSKHMEGQPQRQVRHRGHGRMHKPASDDESDNLHSQRKYDSSHQYSRSKGHARESCGFQRPRDLDAEQQPSWRSHSHNHKGGPSSSQSKPSWMKKEYFKETLATKEHQVQEKDVHHVAGRTSAHTPSESPHEVVSSKSSEADHPSHGSSGTPQESKPVMVLSDKELNALGAKLIKAEMLGMKDQYEKLKKEIEEARKARELVGAAACPDGSQRGSREEVVILTRTDSRGFSHPLSEPAEEVQKHRRKTKAVTHNREGERVRYFADDDRHSLKKMFEREKLTTAEDQNAEFARIAGKVRASTSQDYDFDDAALDKAAEYDSSAKQDARDRMKAIQEHKHITKALDKCRYCFDSKEMKKHLIIAVGIRTYLCLPAHQSLTDGHCLIVPQAHVTAGTLLDEDVWLEVQVFRKGLARMFEDMGKDTVFMETAIAFKHHPHMFLECIPVPKEIGDLAPMYFKKAILECETEWAQNRKLVDLSKKGLRNSIPKGLPYFSVDFGLQGGFAHVIEDEKDFPSYFGKEIVGGLLDLEPRLWLKLQHEKFDEQRKKVLEFTNWWKPYDWTERLKTEDS